MSDLARQTTEDVTPADSTVDVLADIARFAAMGLLPTLLSDRSTGGNIVWASDAYAELGPGFAATDEIWPMAVTGEHAGLVTTRASKARDVQAAFTKTHAEVFTPLWVIKMMVDEADRAWEKSHEDATWREYVTSPRLEITCGEAPYLVSRYDAADGHAIPLGERTGILDRKLARIPKYFKRRSWVTWAQKAVQSTYGYEFQGDNLLIARVNVLATVEDWCEAAGFSPLTRAEYERLAEVVSWNLWQMDGLSDCVPFGEVEQTPEVEYTPTLFDVSEYTVAVVDGQLTLFGEKTMPGLAKVYDWAEGTEVAFRDLKRKGDSMKFDYVIGNPPYQDESDTNGRKPPVYDRFMDAAYEIGGIVELITPARFLFDAGQTKKSWNEKMLSDEHIRVLYYETDATKVFSNTEIKGGVAVTIRDAEKVLGPIGVFTAFPELNQIIQKVNAADSSSDRLDIIFASQRLYKFSDLFFEDFADDPNAQFFLGTGTRNKILSSAMEKMPNVFIDKPAPDEDDVRFLGRIENRRQWRYIKRGYLKQNDYLDSFKLLVPEANNSGRYGETLTEPLIGRPGEGTADTFLNAGPFKTEAEARNLGLYYKTKFFRALLGARKVTQHCPAPVWHTIPLQDFTSSSDIDWSQSVSDIDQQLYEKYGLDDDEVAFIESHVKEMR